MTGLSPVAAAGAAALALALLVERVLELLKSGFDLVDARRGWHRVWTAGAERAARLVERRLQAFEHADPATARAFLRRFDDLLVGPRDAPTGTLPTISGDLVRAAWVRLGCRTLGIALGLALAAGFGIDLLAASRGEPTPGPLGTTLTGVAIGLGSSPVHKLLTTLERAQARRATRTARHA